MEAVTSYSKVLDQQETYVPSLKGRAECYYQSAIKSIHQVFDDNAVHFINLALQDLAKAVVVQPSFVSLWKLIGDCCLSLHCVADDHVARLTVPAALLGDQDAGSGHVTKEGLLHIGTRYYDFSCLFFKLECRAYGRGLSLCDGDSPHLLHNLSAVYYHLAKVMRILRIQLNRTSLMWTILGLTLITFTS
jgi:superkiller protein 3